MNALEELLEDLSVFLSELDPNWTFQRYQAVEGARFMQTYHEELNRTIDEATS